MSRLIEDQGHYLQLLQSTSKLQRKALLTTITKPQLKALCEITHNVLKGTVELSPSEKKTLKRYKKILTLLGKKIYETRETESITKRINGGRFSFIEYCWSFIMDKMILISFEKYKNLTSRQTSKELKGTGYQMTNRRNLGPPGTPEKRNEWKA